MIAVQNCSMPSSRLRSEAGNCVLSGSSPTQSIDCLARQDRRSLVWKSRLIPAAWRSSMQCPPSVLQRNRPSRAQIGGLSHLVVKLRRRLLLEDVEVSVAAYLEHLGARLHACTRRRTDVEVDYYLHRCLSFFASVRPWL